jgi:hypothetical protein
MEDALWSQSDVGWNGSIVVRKAANIRLKENIAVGRCAAGL